MQLTLTAWSGTVTDIDESIEFTVKSEPDILKAGFFAARLVREWLRAMPFVPSSANLRFAITAAVVADSDKSAADAAERDAPRPKRKRKASK